METNNSKTIHRDSKEIVELLKSKNLNNSYYTCKMIINDGIISIYSY